MKTPIVAIVGRPNVGKSTFLNMVAGKAISIVDNEYGVTRDRVIVNVEWAGVKFSLVDTGGIDFDSTNAFSVHIREQVDIAISTADCVIMLTDGQAGVTAGDIEIAQLLRRSKKPLVLAVNKVDNKRVGGDLYDFYKLNVGEPMGLSSTQKLGVGDLLDAVVDRLREGGKLVPADDDETEPIRLAIVGKPNAGKSSIVNKLLGEKRVMVSEVAGTTRDTIDSPFRWNGRDFILTDTAGIRRKRSVEVQTIEHYSVLRAIASMRNSDVVIIVVDATQGLTEQDVRLAGYAHEDGKPTIICINKWDLMEKDTHTMHAFTNQLKVDLAFMLYFKAIFISAETGQRIGEIMKTVDFVMERANTRITTGLLNNLLSQFVASNQPPYVSGKRAKFKYATQVGTAPPTFALFVNNKECVPSTYLRYLENCLRKSVDLTGTPVRFLLRNSSDKEDRK